MNKSHKYAVTVVGASALTPFAAFAAVPASVTAGVTEAVTDVGVIGAAVLGVIIVMAAFSWLRRMVK
ncbi:MAG: major capsid protein [Nitrosomonas sp.]|uniref:major capsid protein n=1 Tax=Nitrosomonas sp. TaxID=42353 RepID=UPI002736D5D8|nr:major capsid protein [Nitrosomonas sp.]MDP3663706.1 major capsid protein [Nitrosomonas sp.]MDZ4106358.1 major capsid protein [Nitrosomonas sp.]